jgi:hypothetical protein
MTSVNAELYHREHDEANEKHNREPDIARDPGPFNVREAKASLDYHVAKAAKRGDYGAVCDLQAVAELIDELVADADALRSAGGEMVRRALAMRESLTSIP